ncbi:MAG: ABC transporter permease [Deltaproteobacteria bacterium]|jgi:spermidine/putrescine transport system permease protein|nr:ABC transporter permease [Deltaproteobacteria bacterium]
MKYIKPLIAVVAFLGMFLMYLPSVAVGIFSVNDAIFGLAWRGFTLKWYERLFQNEYIIEAALNTLIVATLSTIIATVLGTALAIGLYRSPWPASMQRFFDQVINLPVVVPDIIMAVALALAFNVLRMVSKIFDMGMVTLIVAHVTFQISFVTLVVKSRLDSLGSDLDEAAFDLYATTFFRFRKVTLPLIFPGVVAGAMLAFTLSLDDFIISFFNHGPESITLPIYVYAAIKRGLTPEIHALSTVMLILTAIPVIVIERITRKF